MKSKLIFQLFLLTLVVCFVASPAHAQTERPRPSAKMTATGKVGEANVTVNYSSPSVKERKIWGELVPFGQVWRSGANEATIFVTDKDIDVEGKRLPAGTYSLYTIPGETEWQVILNSQTGQWGIKRSGETTRDPEKDVLVVTVIPRPSLTMQEQLVYDINKSGLVLRWEHLEVPVSIK
jgi:hypothetical protein